MFDSLVIDLIFKRGAALAPELLVKALGGEEEAGNRKILDPDMQGPQFEMELSPSMPFRQRGERRLLIIDDSVAPMRENPREDWLVPLDLRPERDRLLELCTTSDVRFGRIFALGTWGDAVMVARSALDLRAMALLSWVLDPTIDVDGKRRGARLTQQEFETKIEAYDKRLEEIEENDLLAGLHGARVERHGDFLVVDVLEEDGTWDVRKSLQLEAELAAIERFSLIPGAPASKRRPAADQEAGDRSSRTGEVSGGEASGEVSGEASGEASGEDPPANPLRALLLDDDVLLVFPPGRFDLDTAAALGKKDFGAVLHARDPIDGPIRDRIHRDGAYFLTPLEFLSEVFVDGKPLSRGHLEEHAETIADGVRALEAHCPRYGRVTLLVRDGSGERYITSAVHAVDQVLRVV